MTGSINGLQVDNSLNDLCESRAKYAAIVQIIETPNKWFANSKYHVLVDFPICQECTVMQDAGRITKCK